MLLFILIALLFIILITLNFTWERELKIDIVFVAMNLTTDQCTFPPSCKSSISIVHGQAMMVFLVFAFVYLSFSLEQERKSVSECSKESRPIGPGLALALTLGATLWASLGAGRSRTSWVLRSEPWRRWWPLMWISDWLDLGKRWCYFQSVCIYSKMADIQ